MMVIFAFKGVRQYEQQLAARLMLKKKNIIHKRVPGNFVYR